MARRLWFINAPSGKVDLAQRSQLAINWSFKNIIIIPINYLNYIRSYLSDNDSVIVKTDAPVSLLSPTSSYLSYIRSYLGDV